ncbi:MAG: response regulator [Pseudomonadota bacterium]|nr:response regulator [Pseudomonadota bacterium]
MVAASALRVMIVDDDEGMRTLMRRTLERMGFSQIYTAKDGSEGLELARSQRPDVIVSDYDMPNMHGLQFLKAVREEPALAKTAFVMLSGVANDRVIERAGELGANSIITKPFLAADLKHRLEALVHELTGSRIEWELSKRPSSGLA